MSQTSGAGVGNVAGTPLIIQTTPTPVPVGSGCTLVNQSNVTVTLCPDENFETQSSWTLPANGASHPVPNGPLYAMAPSQTTILVIPEVLNFFNPNVLTSTSMTELFSGVGQNLSGQPVTLGPFEITDPTIKTLVLVLPRVDEQTQTNGVLEVTVGTADPNNPLASGIPLLLNVKPYLREGNGVFPSFEATYTYVIPLLNPYGNVLINIGKVTPVGTLVAYQLFGDTGEYKESRFYTGQIQAANNALAAAGSVVLLNGPARILAVQASALLSTGGVFLAIAANQGLLGIDATASNTATQGLTLPENTILPVGSSLSLQQTTTGGSRGSVTFAYP